MDEAIVVLGYGTVGRAVTAALVARGATVRVAQRSRPAALPAGASHVACDVMEAESVRQAIAGARQLVLAIGFPYDARVWRTAWPRAMRSVVEASAATGARVVFVDNLYQLGPQGAPRREDMPLRPVGRKAAILAEVTQLWTAAAASQRIRLAALRCSDFYGPGVAVSHLGEAAFGRLAQGKAALLLAPPDTPHDFAYVPDIARAVLHLLDAPDDAFNQVWNMPCAPTRTPREILALGAAALGVRPRLWAVPLGAMPVLGLAAPMLREVADVGFTWDRAYVVDGGKFARRFGFETTAFEVGAPAAMRSFANVGQDNQTVENRSVPDAPAQAVSRR